MNEAALKVTTTQAGPGQAPAAAGSGARRLGDLLKGLACRCSGRSDQVMISAITADSREAAPGTLFVAVNGLRADGHRFVADALARGCPAAVVESGRPATGAGGGVVVEVEDSREALGRIAAALYGHPGRDLQLIGITGTNGKTTWSYLLEELIRAGGGNPGVIGTVNYRYGGRVLPAPFTTPEPVILQRTLHQMREAGVTHAIMEVSSHSLEQKRVAGLEFDLALFTNLSRDHLDFHADMAAYFRSKRKLFTDRLKTKGRAVVMVAPADGGPAGEGWGGHLAGELRELFGQARLEAGERRVLTCGLGPGCCDIRPTSFQSNLSGLKASLHTPAGELIIESPLLGLFNLENLLVTTGAAMALGLSPTVIQAGLAKGKGAPGRLERLPVKAGVEVLVDYAHTPAALENVIETLRRLRPGRLIVLFGCGGDRDRGKRPLMGEIAARLADIVLVTADNPRSEDPAAIFTDIEQGVRATGIRKAYLPRMRAEVLLRGGLRGYDIVPSRREAIGMAIRYSRPGDMILISGKGHEDYQITRAGRLFFDDRLEVKRQAAVIAW